MCPGCPGCPSENQSRTLEKEKMMMNRGDDDVVQNAVSEFTWTTRTEIAKK